MGGGRVAGGWLHLEGRYGLHGDIAPEGTFVLVALSHGGMIVDG